MNSNWICSQITQKTKLTRRVRTRGTRTKTKTKLRRIRTKGTRTRTKTKLRRIRTRGTSEAGSFLILLYNNCSCILYSCFVRCSWCWLNKNINTYLFRCLKNSYWIYVEQNIFENGKCLFKKTFLRFQVVICHMDLFLLKLGFLLLYLVNTVKYCRSTKHNT